MKTQTGTQQSEAETKAALAGTLTKLHRHCDNAIRLAETALGALRSIKGGLDAVPRNGDLNAIVNAVHAAEDEWLEPAEARLLRKDIDRVTNSLKEAATLADRLAPSKSSN